jgi:PII-like signaling protein
MPGFFLEIFVQEKLRHHGILAYEWLLEEARRLGLPGGSAFRALASFGRHGVLHEQHFFELAGDLTIAVGFIVSDEQATQLLARLSEEKLNLVWAKSAVEHGVTGTP